MKNMLKKYIAELDEITKQKKITNREEILEDLKVKIGFFQHERFVHLIVTMFTGTFSLMTFLVAIISCHIELYLLTAILVLLFVPYIAHYFFLENNVQKLYTYYDILKK